MGIEYKEGIEPGQVIDLNQFKRKDNTKRFGERFKHPEKYLPMLEERMVGVSERVNEEFGEFLDEKGRIIMVGEEVDKDKESIVDKEEEWAEREGLEPEESRRRKEKNKAHITELALTVAFDKFLGDDFIVARASDYDDYKNGVDQVIIDKKTGAVVCGLDEVISQFKNNEAPIKDVKTKEKLEKGGSRVKYGATIQEGKLVRQSLKNIPTFYIAIGTEELNELLVALEKNENEISEVEMNLFNKLMASLDRQYKKADKMRLNPNLKNNLDKFRGSLDKIKSRDYNIAK